MFSTDRVVSDARHLTENTNQAAEGALPNKDNQGSKTKDDQRSKTTKEEHNMINEKLVEAIYYIVVIAGATCVGYLLTSLCIWLDQPKCKKHSTKH